MRATFRSMHPNEMLIIMAAAVVALTFSAPIVRLSIYQQQQPEQQHKVEHTPILHARNRCERQSATIASLTLATLDSQVIQPAAGQLGNTRAYGNTFTPQRTPITHSLPIPLSGDIATTRQSTYQVGSVVCGQASRRRSDLFGEGSEERSPAKSSS